MGKFVGPKPSLAPGVGGASAKADASFMQLFPGLWEYLSVDRWDSGAPRKTSTLLVFWSPAGFQGCLNDRAVERTAWVTSDSFTGVLEALERAIEKDELQWRDARQWRRGKGGK